jgi:integrase
MSGRIRPRAGLSEQVIGKGKDTMTRSRYQSGSVFVRGKRRKMYIARYYEKVIGPDGRPRRMRRSLVLGLVAEVGTRRAAQNRLAELLRPINLGRQKPRVMLTFGDFVREQWVPKVLGLFKLSSQVGYRPLLSKHLLPYFDGYALSEIVPLQIQGFLTEKARTGISWHSVRNMRNLLSSVLRTAVEWGYLEENPASKVKLPPRPVRTPPRYLLPGQVRQLLAEIPEPWRSMVLLAVLTGLRRGELFALRWGAVDLERGVLAVRESVYNGQFSTPKTHSSMRRIPLSSPVVELFRKRKAEVGNTRSEDLVFFSRRKTPFRPGNILKRFIHPACDRLGIPRVGWHTFRHTHATLLNELGENPKTAQAILGHSDIQTTLQVYTHAVPESVSNAEERLAQAVMDPNGLKFKTGAKPRSEQGVWIQ